MLPRERSEEEIDTGQEDIIKKAEKGGKYHNRYKNDLGRRRYLFSGRPRHLFKFCITVLKEPYDFLHQMLLNAITQSTTYNIRYRLNIQARQDSNLQHSVLETDALPIGATGLNANNLFLRNALLRRAPDRI